ncbi:MAG: hypothetical protein U0X91_12865 [Spirosomataceae bacterium]
MKTILLINLLVCLFLCSSCKDNGLARVYNKLDNLDLRKGKAILRNKLLDTKDTSVAQIVVYLSRSMNSDPYLYKVETDATGEYILPFLPEKEKDETYYLVGEYTGTDKIKYIGSQNVSNITDPLVLVPTYPRGKLKVTFLQSKAANVAEFDPNSPVNGAEVYLFANRDQAQSLLLTSSPKGQLAKKNTNERGVALFYDLRKTTYYVVGKVTDAKGKSVYSSIKEVEVKDETDSSQPQPETMIANVNKTLIVKVTDASSSTLVLPGVEVYLFKDNSQISSLSNKNGPFGVERVATTLANGEAKFEDLTEPGYYVGLRFKRADGELFTSSATSLNLTAVETYSERSISITNIPFKVKVTTGTTNPELVYNATVYLFTNRTQAAAILDPDKEPTAFFRKAVTQANGEATFLDIFSGTYYIGAIIPISDGQKLRKLKPDPVNAPTMAVIEY